MPRTLTINVRARRAERLFSVLALFGVVGAAVLLYAPASTLAAGLFIFMTIAAAFGLWRQGWLGGAHRLASISWLADGRWQLRDERHTDVTAELRADSLVGARWLWLRWNAESAWMPRPSMLLVHGDVADADLRRLIVRLRLDAPPLNSPVRDDAF